MSSGSASGSLSADQVTHIANALQQCWAQNPEGHPSFSTYMITKLMSASGTPSLPSTVNNRVMPEPPSFPFMGDAATNDGLRAQSSTSACSTSGQGMTIVLASKSTVGSTGSINESATLTAQSNELGLDLPNNTRKRALEGEFISTDSSRQQVTLRLYSRVKTEGEEGDLPSSDTAESFIAQRPSKRTRIDSPTPEASPDAFIPEENSSSSSLMSPRRTQRSAKSKAVKGITDTYLATADWAKGTRARAHRSRVDTEESDLEDSTGSDHSGSSASDDRSESPHDDVEITNKSEKQQTKKWHGFYERPDDGDTIGALKRRCDGMISTGQSSRAYRAAKRILESDDLVHHEGDQRCENCRASTNPSGLPPGMDAWPCLSTEDGRCVRCHLLQKSCTITLRQQKKSNIISSTPADGLSSGRLDFTSPRRLLSVPGSSSSTSLASTALAGRSRMTESDLASHSDVPTPTSTSGPSMLVRAPASALGSMSTSVAVGGPTASISEPMASRDALSAGTALGPRDRLSNHMRLSAGDILELASEYQAGQGGIGPRFESEIEVLLSLVKKMKQIDERHD